jgi:hypothetical protein
MRTLSFCLMVLVSPAAFAQLPAPDLLLPEDEGWRWVDDYNEWSEVPGAVDYRAQIDTLGGDFSVALADTVLAGTSWGNGISPGFYVWRVAAYDGDVWSDWSEVWTFESRFPVNNEPDASAQKLVEVEKVFPNPSNGIVQIRFIVHSHHEAELRVYDALGRETATLYRGTTVGVRDVVWDASSLPAGTYFLVLRSNSSRTIERVVIVE